MADDPRPPDVEMADLAAAIVGSESFMWIMCGGDPQWLPSHVDALRPAWSRWRELRRGAGWTDGR